MNDARRKQLGALVSTLEQVQSDLEALKDEEQEYYDNMPEAFQSGGKGRGSRGGHIVDGRCAPERRISQGLTWGACVMAKKYEFELHAIKCVYDRSSPTGYVGVITDCRDFYRDNALALLPFEGTLAEAVAERAKQAALLNKDASWLLSMKDRNAKKPAGVKAVHAFALRKDRRMDSEQDGSRATKDSTRTSSAADFSTHWARTMSRPHPSPQGVVHRHLHVAALREPPAAGRLHPHCGERMERRLRPARSADPPAACHCAPSRRRWKFSRRRSRAHDLSPRMEDHARSVPRGVGGQQRTATSSTRTVRTC